MDNLKIKVFFEDDKGRVVDWHWSINFTTEIMERLDECFGMSKENILATILHENMKELITEESLKQVIKDLEGG
jgi:hypothetical protein